MVVEVQVPPASWVTETVRTPLAEVPMTQNVDGEATVTTGKAPMTCVGAVPPEGTGRRSLRVGSRVQRSR